MPLVTFDDRNVLNAPFAVITGTLPNSAGFTGNISYPAGFTKDNSTMVSLKVDTSLGMRSGVGISGDTYERYFVNFSDNYFQIYTNSTQTYGKKYWLVLMRTDLI